MSDSRTDQSLEPGLYIVATPIGNLGDITLRCLDILRRCDVVACEDTRVTGKLLKHFDIRKPLWRYDDHSSDKERHQLLTELQQKAVALVSDAGTPLISDPGYQLAREARVAGAFVTSLPGPCAAISALALSGLPTNRFLFAGFLPPKENARKAMLEELADVDATLIFYETSPRLLRTLNTLSKCWPDRRIVVARELTKLYEECRNGTAHELIAHYEAHPPKGEIVLLVEPPVAKPQDFDIDTQLITALADNKPSQAAARVARETGLERKMLYARALELRSE